MTSHGSNKAEGSPLSALMIGTGEYTTGFVHGAASSSDKSAGVVALTLFDLRASGEIDRLLMAGTNGQKYPSIREHLQRAIADRYTSRHTQQALDIGFESFPADTVARDPDAYLSALDQLSPGDAVVIFTPDDTHFDMAMAAVDRGCHVLIAKPLVKTLAQHLALCEAAEAKGVLVAMEVHKRWDPIYLDARDRIRDLGPCGFFSAYMSQPQSQLETFRSWAGRSSDISYYLNAHHIDFHQWAVSDFARPIRVTAMASNGVASARDIPAEDTITLCTQWENLADGSQATALYTASWAAPKNDVHSQQHFFYQGHLGEVRVDQAHRGYSLATDATGHQSPNPLFMKYTPDPRGCFVGQQGYGYQSIADFIAAVNQIREGKSNAEDWHHRLATAKTTTRVTAILEAGRRSLDAGNLPQDILYREDGQPQLDG